jgi:hypothetical protein
MQVARHESLIAYAATTPKPHDGCRWLDHCWLAELTASCWHPMPSRCRCRTCRAPALQQRHGGLECSGGHLGAVMEQQHARAVQPAAWVGAGVRWRAGVCARQGQICRCHRCRHGSVGVPAWWFQQQPRQLQVRHFLSTGAAACQWSLQGLSCCGRLLQARQPSVLLCTTCPPGQQVLPLHQVVLVTLGAAAAEEPDAVGVAGQVAAGGRRQAVSSPRPVLTLLRCSDTWLQRVFRESSRSSYG